MNVIKILQHSRQQFQAVTMYVRTSMICFPVDCNYHRAVESDLLWAFLLCVFVQLPSIYEIIIATTVENVQDEKQDGQMEYSHWPRLIIFRGAA